MMGIPCNEPSFVLGYNKSVLNNVSIPSSLLKKKCHSIAYNFIREGVTKNEWLITYVPMEDNIADLLTKPLYGEHWMHLIRQVQRYL